MNIAYEPTNQEILKGRHRGQPKHLGICTWIDNFYCAANTTEVARAIAEDVEKVLKERW